MPLPVQYTEWPPKEFDRPHRDVAGWSAWWSGDADELSQYYGGDVDQVRHGGFYERGGLAGSVARFFWGQRATDQAQRTKLHMPLASEIAQVSADLLFGAPPTIEVRGSKPTQERLEELLGEEAHAKLHDAAEACAALGHVYLRVGWDRDVDPTGPLVSVIDADCAYPRFSHGVLVAVTFVSEWIDGTTHTRHLEHHEPGHIEHGLYVGTADNLGRSVPLTEHHATAGLLGDDEAAEGVAILADGRVVIETGVDMIDVVAVPNARPRTKAWRRNPAARDLGRADIASLEGMLDALDDTYTSWMRDIRHGRSRLHVPQHYLKSLGPGQGAIADIDRELYVTLNAMVDTQGPLQIQAQQFAIRWQEHRETGLELITRITSGAGYSPQTFGLSETTALTAAESWNRQIRTQNLRAAKIRRWRVAMRRLAELLIAFDRTLFNGRGDPDKAAAADVNFQESVAESQQARAQTVALIAGADAASIETMVAMLHPDWDKTQRDEEVQRIKDAKEARTPPSFEPGGPPEDDDNPFGDNDPDDDTDDDQDEDDDA